MTVDLSDLHQILASLAFAAITGAIPVVIAFLKSHLNGIKNEQERAAASDAVNALDKLCEQGAGYAYNWMKQTNVDLDHPAIHNAALAQATMFIASVAPGYLQAAGVNSDTVRAKVAAEFGKLLAVDANVTVSSGSRAVDVSAGANHVTAAEVVAPTTP
jgi:hypothetical protein